LFQSKRSIIVAQDGSFIEMLLHFEIRARQRSKIWAKFRILWSCEIQRNGWWNVWVDCTTGRHSAAWQIRS